MGKREETKGTDYQWEASLHRAWEGLHFDRRKLCTADAQPLRILHPGTLNHDQGPDFLDACIQIGKEKHFGHVELHLKADDWTRHGHHRDPHYNAVMLHVYLVRGKAPALRADGWQIPELWLGDRIAPAMLPGRPSTLPCSGVGKLCLPRTPSFWLETAGFERLLEKAKRLEGSLKALQYDWSQVLWEEIAASLGGPVNGQCFRQLANQANWSLIRKYVYSQDCLEAILFGCCGMLDGPPKDTYQALLKENWDYLRQKHRLRQKPIPFKFHRMHPAGFPQLRIAQMAMLAMTFRPICQLLEVDQIRRFCKEWSVGSDYWAFRYDFGNCIHSRPIALGVETRLRIVMNALVPLGILGIQNRRLGTVWETCIQPQIEANSVTSAMAGSEKQSLMDNNDTLHATDGNEEINALMELLRTLAPENNKITRKFLPLGLQPMNALQAQGMMGIYKGKCSAFRCLECEIGVKAISGGDQ